MVPSRVFVGVVVFGLIASLVTVPYTALVLAGYRPPPVPPAVQVDEPVDAAKQVFLVLASLFSVGLTVVSWRLLVVGARKDAERRRTRDKLAREQRAYKQRPGGPN